MRYSIFVVLPYVVFTAVFAFGFAVIQGVEHRMCANQRQVYAILSSGMRRRAVFADAYVTATGDKPYGRELRREADEIAKVSATITGCAAK